MDWIYEGTVYNVYDGTSYGFVYLIENMINGKLYYGKKQFKLRSTKTVKGKRKRILKESNWLDYYGSSETLKGDVEIYGKENFKRTILKMCSSKSELSYYEAKYQFENNVLLFPEKYYNSWISVKVTRKHMKITP
jgi:hypothetical protein